MMPRASKSAPTKPTVATMVPASFGTPNWERIIEVGNGERTESTYKGALISLRRLSDGRFLIEVYNADPGVVVRFSDVERRIKATEHKEVANAQA
jgi:predicted RNase H-like nuclease